MKILAKLHDIERQQYKVICLRFLCGLLFKFLNSFFQSLFSGLPYRLAYQDWGVLKY